MSMFDAVLGINWDNYDVRYRTDSTLGQIVNNITESIAFKLPAGLSEEDYQRTIINSLDQYMESDEGKYNYNILQDYALKLADQYNNAFTTLKTTVAEQVEYLSGKILEQSEKRMANSTGYYELNGETIPTTANFNMFDVSGITDIGSIASELCTKYEFKSTDGKLTPFGLKYILEKIPDVEEVKLSPAAYDKVIDHIFQTKFDQYKKCLSSQIVDIKTQIRQFVYSVTSPIGYNILKNRLFKKDIYQGQINCNTIKNCMSFLNMYPTLNVFTDEDLELSDQTKEQLNKNFEVLSEINKCCAIVLVLADKKYEDTLVIGADLINKKEFNKFQELGGTLEDIQDFLRLYHNQNKDDILYHQAGHLGISVNGIKMDTIYLKMQNTKTKLLESQNIIKTKLVSLKNNSIRNAFESVTKEYINDIVTNTPQMITTDETPIQFRHRATEYAKNALQNLVRTDTSNVQDALYSFILNTWYKDSLVSTIYYRLGAELISNLETNGTFDDNTARYIDAAVMSEIICSYISKVYMTKM